MVKLKSNSKISGKKKKVKKAIARTSSKKSVAKKYARSKVVVQATVKPVIKQVYKRVKKILISQPPPETEKNPYTEIASRFNVKIDFRPFIQIEGIEGKDFRKFKVNPTDFTAVVFNSKNAIDHFFRVCDEMRMRMSMDTKYYCISEAVALYLQKYILYRKRKVFFGNGKEDEMVDIMMKHGSDVFLLPCSDNYKEGLISLMEEKGLSYVKAVIYRTISTDLSDLKKKFDYDVIAFFSPYGVKSLFDNFPKFKQDSVRIAAFGKVTSKAVVDHKLRLDIEAPLPEAPSMASALSNYLSVSNKHK